MCFSLKRHSSLLEMNLCPCIPEKESVTFTPSERWRLLTSPCSFKTFFLGVPDGDFDFSGDGGPLLTYMKQTSLTASFFPSSKFSRFQPEDLYFRQAGIRSYCEPCYFLNTVKPYMKLIPKLPLFEFRNGFSGF